MKKGILLAVMMTALVLLSESQESDIVHIQDNAFFWYVCLEYSGSIDQDKISQFFQEARKQQLEGKVHSDLFSIWYNSPLISEGRKETWGLGFKIDEATDIRPPLIKRRYDYARVVTTIHRGPFETAGSSMNRVVAFIEERGMKVVGPPVEIWIGDPSQDKPEDLKTEILVPVGEIHRPEGPQTMIGAGHEDVD